MSRISVGFGGVLVAAAVAIAPAAAQDAEGFFIFGNFTSAEADNTSLNAATLEQDFFGSERLGELQAATLAGQVFSPLRAEIGSEFTVRLGGGYSFGEKGKLTISYWNFDGNDATTIPMGDTGTSFNSLDSMFGDGWFPSDGSATVRGDVEATSIDVNFSKSRDLENGLSVTWMTGIRSVSYEEMIFLNGSDTSGFDTIEERYTLDVDGIGFKVGALAEYGLGDNFSLYAGISTSFVTGDADEVGISVTDDEALSSDGDASGLIWDAKLGVNVFKNDRVKIGIEYNHSSWNDIVTRNVFGTEDENDFKSPTRSNVSFQGIGLSVAVMF